MKDSKKTFEEFEKALDDKNKEQSYILKLYMTGINAKSQTALRNIKEICETHLEGRYELEVIDVYQTPHLAKNQQIIAAPTLIKELPSPVQRFIGDLSDTDQVLVGLDIKKD